jgi:hypothetical protein
LHHVEQFPSVGTPYQIITIIGRNRPSTSINVRKRLHKHPVSLRPIRGVKATAQECGHLAAEMTDETLHGRECTGLVERREELAVSARQEAYRCFMRTQMDALVLEDVLICKSEQRSSSQTSVGLVAGKPPNRRSSLPALGELRRFGLAMTVLLTVVGGLLMWSGRQLGGGVFVALAITAALTAASVPRVLFRAYRIGRALSERIAKVLTFLLLAGTFCLIVTPLALLARAVSKREVWTVKDWTARHFSDHTQEMVFGSDRGVPSAHELSHHAVSESCARTTSLSFVLT